MKKIKLYSIISILITIILFGTAAICNQCGITPATEIETVTETDVNADGESNTTEKVSGTTQSQKITEETTAKQTTESEDGRAEIVNFSFDPKSGPGGTEVKLSLSAPITSSAKVYYNGQTLPKAISADSKTFTVTIPVGASNGYFKIEYDGKSVQAAEQFTVTPPPQADLVITNIGPVSTTRADKIYVDIKNVGTADLNNADIHVKCQALGLLRSNPDVNLIANSDEWLKVTLNAGGTGFFYPSMIIDVSLYKYSFVMCTIVLDGDPTPENVLQITIP